MLLASAATSEPVNISLRPLIAPIVAIVVLSVLGVMGVYLLKDHLLDRVERAKERIPDRIRIWSRLTGFEPLLQAPEPSGRPAPERRRRALVVGFDLAAVSAVMLAVGARAKAFTGLPPGSDIWGHLAKIRLIEHDWPHIAWNASWYNGSPYFTGSYPPGYHATVIAISKLTGLPDWRAMAVASALALCGIAVGIYLTAFLITGRRSAGWLAALFIVGTGSLWSHVLGAGLQPRMNGEMGAALALAGTVAVVRRTTPWRVAGAAVAMAWCLDGHLFVGFVAIILCGSILMLAPAHDRAPRRFARAVLVLGLGGCIDGFFYLPFMSFTQGASQIGVEKNSPAPWRSLFGPVGPLANQIEGLAVGLFPVLVVCLGVLAFQLRRQRPAAGKVLAARNWRASRTIAAQTTPSGAALLLVGPRVTGTRSNAWPAPAAPAQWVYVPKWHEPLERRIMVALLVGAAITGTYCFAGHFTSKNFYVLGMHPIDMIMFPAIVLAPAAAVAVHEVTRTAPKIVRSTAWSVVLAVGVVSAVIGASIAPRALRPNDIALEPSLAVISGQMGATGAGQGRLLSWSDAITRPLNAADPVPQVRGYQANAIADADWQFLVESVTQDSTLSPATFDAMLDWWAIRWVIAGTGTTQTAPFTSRPDRFTPGLIDDKFGWKQFEVKGASPIVTATTAPIVLMIGDRLVFQNWFRTFTSAGVGSNRAVLVKGPDTLGGLKESDLVGVDTVVLDGDATDGLASGSKKLDTWVRGGGHLYIEQVTTGINLKAKDTLPDPFPVTAAHVAVVNKAWNFPDDVTLPGIKTTDFSPADWNNSGRWEIEAGTKLKPWATSTLTTGGRFVLVDGDLGQGKVTWSGMNLVYHADSTKNLLEQQFVARIMGVPDLPASTDASGVTVASNESMDVTAPAGSKGVLIKETLGVDWIATVDGHPAPIRYAGPAFMYVPVPVDGKSHRVAMTYRLSNIERGGIVLSLITVSSVIVMVIGPQRWARRRRRRVA